MVMMDLNEIDRATSLRGTRLHPMKSEGQIIRTVPTMGLAYLAESSNGKVIGFSVSQLQGYRGESFEEMDLTAGATFCFETDSSGQVVKLVQKQADAAAASA